MNDLNKSHIEGICRELQSELNGTLAWKWDGRFETALAEFESKDKDGVRAILERHLSSVWDGSTIGYAPDAVRAVNIRIGALRSEQLLFTSDASREAFIFCVWWPWSDGRITSIRVGPFHKKISNAESAEKLRLFRCWFGLQLAIVRVLRVIL